MATHFWSYSNWYYKMTWKILNNQFEIYCIKGPFQVHINGIERKIFLKRTKKGS